MISINNHDLTYSDFLTISFGLSSTVAPCRIIASSTSTPCSPSFALHYCAHYPLNPMRYRFLSYAGEPKSSPSCSSSPSPYVHSVAPFVLVHSLNLTTLRFQCAVLAAAVIGAFSWSSAFGAYWLAPALWYCSLVLSILGMMLAAQQIAVVQLLEARRSHVDARSIKPHVDRYLPLMLTEIRQQSSETELQMDGNAPVRQRKPRWKMVFIWQCPMMFMSYSLCSFLSGLTIYVCTPLIRGEAWNSGSNVSCSSFFPWSYCNILSDFVNV